LILADTSVWIDHLNRGDQMLQRLLQSDAIVMHPFVLGEIALGGWALRAATLHALERLPRVVVAQDSEVMRLIEDWSLFGSGIGYLDAHLLAAVLLTPDTRLWTRDKRLRAVARQLSLDVDLV